MTTLDAALQQFEATEANLEKLEKLWNRISGHLPTGPAFGSPPEYEELCLAFRRILPALPAIEGFRLTDALYDYDEVGQMRLDALDLGEVEAQVSVEGAVEGQGRLLRQYQFRFRAKRRELVRGHILNLIGEVDDLLIRLGPSADEREIAENVSGPDWLRLKEAISEIDALLGSSERPPRWEMLYRHMHFGMVCDLKDIQKLDWPVVKQGLRASLYGEHDPVPVEVADLSDVVAARPQGPVTTKLNWDVLSDEDFERLIFGLISETPGYENPEWLQQTHAPDRGRDLSVIKIDSDLLSGVRRRRIIIQCKHWLSRSVSVQDVSVIRDQMALWNPPRVDVLVLATSGRFTADAVALVEQHNQADRALAINMWPDSHLERLLAARPHLIAQFRLRQNT